MMLPNTLLEQGEIEFFDDLQIFADGALAVTTIISARFALNTKKK